MASVAQAFMYPKPQVLYVDEDNSVKSPAHDTIDALMGSLKENGPLVAVGKMGPGAYTVEPFKLTDKVVDEEVYGWKPRTFKDNAASTTVILLGAKKTEATAYIYFTLARDITRDGKSLIRGFIPLETDAKVYVMSYDNFLQRSLVNLHPICLHARWLFSVDTDSILDRGVTEKRCKEIGQEIFDYYKKLAKGDFEAGRSAVKRICNAAVVLTPNGTARRDSIECAWDGIGDSNWRWHH